MKNFFGFTNWPNETVFFNLGGRILRVIAGPGHEEAATLFYDPWTGVLFTGDTVYPGRLYVMDMPASAYPLSSAWLWPLADLRRRFRPGLTARVGC
jgi:hydroxyacylglutathione hydrolase